MLENREGQKVPNVTFKVRENGEWKQITTENLFANKKVVLFALPGAYTPTCSSAHLPRYNHLADTFFANGIDAIYCLSVNDTFVMNAWAEDQKADKIQMLPDGNGDFSAGMGMLVDKENLGFGKRSWRYAMIVDNGVIQKMFIEPERDGDPFEVSDADTVLKALNPEAKTPDFFTLFSKAGCPYCANAKNMLREAGLPFEEILIGQGASVHAMRAVTGKTATPQVYLDGQHIGDSEDLARFLTQR